MITNQPKWKSVEYSRNQIIKAGKTIKNDNALPQEIDNATDIIDNWRAAHAFPMHVIYMHLRRMATSVNKNIIVAERLKRLDSIINKLKREQTMSLWVMQDLGGCRFIVLQLMMFITMPINMKIQGSDMNSYLYMTISNSLKLQDIVVYIAFINIIVIPLIHITKIC